MMIKVMWVVGVAGALALTACSSSGNKASSSAPPATSATTSAASSSSAGSVKVSVSATPKGKVLTGPNGHALYTYDPDTPTASKCTDACATTWPPLVGTPSAGAGLEASELTTMSRSDGSTQVAYDGHPLYYYAKDTDAEDMYGDGVRGVWHLATATGSSGGGASSSSSSGKY